MTQEAVLKILRAGRALIATPESWTQRSFARTKEGDPCASFSVAAVCYCSLGALNRAGGAFEEELPHNRARRLLSEEMQIAYGDEEGMDEPRTAHEIVTYFNDNKTHAEVLAAWDRAIAKLEAA